MTEEEKNKAILECGDDFDEILDIRHGLEGTPERNEFECNAGAFILAACLKEERLKARLTQEQLAQKVGTKKCYISSIENGNPDVQLSIIFKIFQGLGKHIKLTIM